MKSKEKIISAVVVAVFTAIFIVLEYSSSQFRLDFKEQIGIFLWNSERISWYLSNPAVLTSIAGDWLTQFFTGGLSAMFIIVAVLALFCWGVSMLGKRLRQEKGANMAIVFAVALLEMTFLKSPNYPLSQTLGLVMVIWAAYGLTFIGNDRIRSAAFAVSIPVMYVLAGSYAIILVLLLCVIDRKNLVRGISLALAGFLAMVIVGHMYNLTFGQTMLYPVLLNYMTPDYWIILLQPVFIILSLLLGENIWYTLLYGCIFAFSGMFNDKSLESAIKTGTYAYQGQWDKIRNMKTNEIYENPYWLYYRNLSLAMEGRLADNLLDNYRGQLAQGQGLFLKTDMGQPYLSSMYNVDALIEVGDLSQATDCALLAQTVLPGHYSTRMLRKLSEISVIAGDYEVAEKYLGLLAKTWGHRAWAENLQNCIAKDSIPLDYLILRTRSSDFDRLFKQGDMKASLSALAKANPTNKVAIDYLLCMYLVDKNVNSFVAAYESYYLNALDQVFEVPEVYQEALLVNVNSDESFQETAEKYRLSEKVVNKYFDFMKAREKGGVNRESVNTYWYYIMTTDLSKVKR